MHPVGRPRVGLVVALAHRAAQLWAATPAASGSATCCRRCCCHRLGKLPAGGLCVVQVAAQQAAALGGHHEGGGLLAVRLLEGQRGAAAQHAPVAAGLVQRQLIAAAGGWRG